MNEKYERKPYKVCLDKMERKKKENAKFFS